MDNGRRSFLQGRDVLTAIVTGYSNVTLSNTIPVLDGTSVLNSNSIIYSATSDNRLMYTTDKSYLLWKEPDWVGYWELIPAPASFRVSTTYKPNWLHRVMTKLFFGWTWHKGKAIK